MLVETGRGEILETLAGGAVIVYGDPGRINQSQSTTEIKLEDGSVLVHKSAPVANLWVPTRLDIVTGAGTTGFPIETQTLIDPEINPHSTVLIGSGRWGVGVLGNMWGMQADLVLAERLLGVPVQPGLRSMVEPSLVQNIRSRISH
jgi:hypothetical protein